jgi:sRNA-binding carbon storage regulator CsrA
MNKLFLGFLLLCNFAAFSQSEADCKRFHTGTFRFSDPRFKNVEVKRTENWQSETDTTDDSEIAGTIEWISPCKYVLTFKTQKNAKVEHMIGKKITTEILEINGNECKIRFNLESAEPMEIMMVKTE